MDTTILDALIAESDAAVTAHNSYDRTEIDTLYERANYCRRRVFIEVLRTLVVEPDATIAELAAKVEMDPQYFVQFTTAEVNGWLQERLQAEGAIGP